MLRIYILSLVAFLMALFGFNLFVDPLGLVHARHVDTILTEEGPGWGMLAARYLPADRLLLGSSVSHGNRTAAFREAAGEGLLNAASYSNAAADQADVARCFLLTRPRATVYWELYVNLLGGIRYATAPAVSCHPALAEYRWYLTAEATRTSIKALTQTPHRLSLDIFDRESENEFDYGYDKVEASLPSLLRGWEEHIPNQWFSAESMEFVVEHHVIPVVEAAPQAQFVFFFPPISVFQQLELDLRIRRMGADWLTVKETLIRRLMSFHNVTVVDFQSVVAKTTDFGQFRDIMHYSPTWQHWVVSELKRGGLQISALNLNETLSQEAAAMAEYRDRYMRLRGAAVVEGSR